MNEVWKPIKGYEGLYEVSNLGRVKSLDRVATATRKGVQFEVPIKGKMLTPMNVRHGYLAVQLYGRGGHKTRNMKEARVHRLVAETFVPNPDNFPEVNHKDENKSNNRADNLEWCDRKYNTNYGTCQQRRVRIGAENPHSIRLAQLTKDGKLVRIYDSINEARRAGYGLGNIYKCFSGQCRYAYGYKWERLEA